MFALLRRIASSLCYIPFSERNSPQTQLMRTSIRSNEPVTVTPREPLVRDYSVWFEYTCFFLIILVLTEILNHNMRYPYSTVSGVD